MPLESLASLDEVLPLLQSCGLPTTDISNAAPPQFYGVRSNKNLIAVIGLERYSDCGLVRSLAVAAAFRGQGLARRLIALAESRAAAQRINQLFLLTSTAEALFLRLGYSPIERAAAPPAIRNTAQFVSLCPASSALLCKHIGTGD